MGDGSKANHLTYLGDAVVGRRVNVGAGTITCNYDGANKFPTHIDDGAFIGSGTMLVAPVRVGAECHHRCRLDHHQGRASGEADTRALEAGHARRLEAPRPEEALNGIRPAWHIHAGLM